jgi:hypothetical protein
MAQQGPEEHPTELLYLWATSWVLRNTDATMRIWWQGGRRTKLPEGVPHEFVGQPVLTCAGPCRPAGWYRAVQGQ